MSNWSGWYVSKRDMTLAGEPVHKGQLVQPRGNVNDQRIYGDSTHWTFRYDPTRGEPELCGTDGCSAQFDCLGNLQRHRQLRHAAERETRERLKRERAAAIADREWQPGDEMIPEETTIGGYTVSQVKQGPGGPVPYLSK